MNVFRRITRTGLAGATTVALLVTAATPLSPAFALPAAETPEVPTTRPVDGTTQASAAASCWEIKRSDRNSESGAYWILTPSMSAPQQVYCDQDTDGGGWVLVGQGREGWSENYEGQGNPDALATTAPGPEAFTPVQLPSTTIDGLLDGQRPDSLPDGLRVRRALDQEGASWQEVRMDTTNRPRWSWTLSAKIPVTRATFDGGFLVTNAMTNLVRSYNWFATGHHTLRFTDRKEQNYLRGFAYGDGIAGSSDEASFLWGTNPAYGAVPFSQVYVRPQITQDAFEGKSLPSEGTAERTLRALPESQAQPTTWGAFGRADGGTGELNTEVQAFAESSGSVFAGGNFKELRRSDKDPAPLPQKFLAAFDVNTGEVRPEFRPTLDGQVKSLAALPGDRLAVGGVFTTVNGVASPGLAVLDARTGELDPAWKLKVENLLTGGVLQVRGLSVQGEHLYLAGSFTHLTGGTNPYPVYARGAAKVNITDGTPVRDWNPNLNGTATDIDASDRGDRVYTAGYFNRSGADVAYRLGAFSADAPSTLIPWSWDLSYGPRAGREDGFQFAVRETGGTVWSGGAEHLLFGYNRDTFQRTQRNITEQGGDFQSISATDTTLYGSCHCGHHVYRGAEKYPVPRAAYGGTDRIDLIGAWDVASGDYLPEFNPRLKGNGGWGVWDSFTDSQGVLWAGGDLIRSETKGGATQWSSGFVRFAPRDNVAPAVASSLKAVLDTRDEQPVHTLTWEPSAEKGVTYQVLSGDRTVATTKDTTLTLPAVKDASYAVRAVDAAGNQSASTPFVSVAGAAAPEEPSPSPTPSASETPEPSATPSESPSPTPSETSQAPKEPYELLAAGSEWSYRFEPTAPPNNWTAPDADLASWDRGNTPLGLGSEGLATTLTRATPAPRSIQLRREVKISKADELKKLVLTTRADDAVIVYVNGTEVARAGLPEGAINHATYATSAPRTAAAVAAPLEVDVPGWLLKDGTNVISAEVHANWSATPDLSFDLSATAIPGDAPTPPSTSVPDSVLIPAGSEWAVRHENSAPASDWFNAPVDPAWQTLVGPIGWGQGVHSVLKADGTRPVSTQLIREFTVSDPEAWHELQLSTRADDGVIVWVNGQEVARKGLPTGEIRWNTFATQAPRTTAATADPVSVVIPASALVTGKNTVAVQMHVNYRNTPDASMDLTLEAVAEQAAEARMAQEAEEQK